MKKSSIIAIITVTILVIAGIVIWIVVSNNKPSGQSSAAPSTGQFTDETTKQEVQIDIVDMSYSPAQITVKKGTKVTWINKDTVGHNVVAADPNNTGGLPTSAPVFGRGGSVSQVFNEVGTFEYLCTPHKQFMRGSVKVVE
jgi:plastocyanin